MRFRIASNPPGLPVLLDGEPTGQFTPVDGEMNPGSGESSFGVKGWDAAGTARSVSTPPFGVSATAGTDAVVRASVNWPQRPARTGDPYFMGASAVEGIVTFNFEARGLTASPGAAVASGSGGGTGLGDDGLPLRAWNPSPAVRATLAKLAEKWPSVRSKQEATAAAVAAGDIVVNPDGTISSVATGWAKWKKVVVVGGFAAGLAVLVGIAFKMKGK